MSDNNFSGITPDIQSYYDRLNNVQETKYRAKTVTSDSDQANNTLSFEDMLLLMVTQLQNQTIDNQTDTNDMMNQIISMTVMQAVTEVSSQVKDLTEANILSYSAALVEQTVTVPEYDPKTGEIIGEKVGEVTATGMYNGQRVIFLGDECYPLNQIMAVGKLPEQKPGTEKPGEGEGTEKPGEGEGVEKPGEGAEKPGEGENVEKPDGSTDVPTTPGTDENAPEENDSGIDVSDKTVAEALG